MLAGLDSVAELVYIPVFDHTIPDTEVQAVLEVILSKHAVDPMAVANAITFISGFLGTLQVRRCHASLASAWQRTCCCHAHLHVWEYPEAEKELLPAQMSLSHPMRPPQQQQQQQQQAASGFGASPFQHQSQQQQQQQQQRGGEQQWQQQQAPTTQVGRPGAAAATNVGQQQQPSPGRTLSRTMSRNSSTRNLGVLDDLQHAMSC